MKSYKYSDDIIYDAVIKYWQDTYPQTVIAFFYQKYVHETSWEWCEELIDCNDSSNYEDVIFQNDFCEGQTCVKDITIVSLHEVTEYYCKNKIRRKEE